MKRLILSLVLFALPFFVSAQTPEPLISPEPAIRFEKTEYDFGQIAIKNKAQSVDFKFENTGTAPLIIILTNASCRCLSVKSPDEPIQPGQTGVIKVTYTPTKKTGSFNNYVTIYSNAAGSDSKITLTVNGEVVK